MRLSLRGDNLGDVRERNIRLILRAILHHGPLARRELSLLTGLTPTTIGNIISELMERNWLQEVGPDERPVPSRRGPRQVLIDFRSQGAVAIGISLGVYTRRVGIVSPQGQILAISVSWNYSEDVAPADSLNWVKATVPDLLEQSGVPLSSLVGIGVSAEGYVDPTSGVRTLAPYRGWGDEPVVRSLEEGLEVSAILASSSQALAVGELWFGHGRTAEDFVVVNLGTTISCSIVARRQVLQGHHHAEGAIGHIAVPGGDLPCACGRRGCLETVAGAKALLAGGLAAAADGRSRLLSGLCGPDGRAVDPPIAIGMIAQAAIAGDSGALEIVEGAAEGLGTVLADVIALVDPELVIVHGRFPLSTGEIYFGPLRQAIAQRSYCGYHQPPPAVMCSLGDQASVVGAAALALERFFYSPQLNSRGRSVSEVDGLVERMGSTADLLLPVGPKA